MNLPETGHITISNCCDRSVSQ